MSRSGRRAVRRRYQSLLVVLGTAYLLAACDYEEVPVSDARPGGVEVKLTTTNPHTDVMLAWNGRLVPGTTEPFAPGEVSVDAPPLSFGSTLPAIQTFTYGRRDDLRIGQWNFEITARGDGTSLQAMDPIRCTAEIRSERTTILEVVEGGSGCTGGGGLPPRVVDGMVVRYDFNEGGGSTVLDVSGVGPSALDLTVTAAPGGAFTWGDGALTIGAVARVTSVGFADKIIGSVMASNEITVEAWITPASGTQTGPARIVTISPNAMPPRNFSLQQAGSSYQVLMRHRGVLRAGFPPGDPMGFLRTATGSVVGQARTHVVYTRDLAGESRIYLNGNRTPAAVASIGVNPGGIPPDWDLSNWERYPLVLANEESQDRPWLGTFHLVAIYDRALSADEVSQNFDATENAN